MHVDKYFIGCMTALLIACGGESDEGAAAASGPDTITVAPSDTIGILMGDSNYVFGTIGDAVYTSDGNIAVMDETGCCVKVFDPSGEFLFQMGREGSGPGELLHPGAMVLLSDGSVGVIDAPTGGLHTYGPGGEFDTTLIEFMGGPVPQWAWGVDSMAFVGAVTDFDQTEETMMVAFRVGRWQLDRQPETVYFENAFPFNPQDMAGMLNGTFFSCTYAAESDGYVYLAPISSSEYRIDVFEPGGELSSSFQRDMPRVEKSEEEIQDEIAMITAILKERGVPEHMIDYSPDPCRWLIQPQGMGADGDGRIWVHNGASESIVMDVYERDGTHVAVVRIEGVENPDIMDFVNIKVQPRGILAYSLQDPGYPRLYVIPMPAI